MAMTVTYTNFGGQLVHENRGGVETSFVPDTLGSVMMCRDSSGNTTYEAEYWPYGEVRSEAGTNRSPWGFVGTLGYYTDEKSKSLYVRARTYLPNYARWATADPLWPPRPPYRYCLSPHTMVDRCGAQCEWMRGGSDVERAFGPYARDLGLMWERMWSWLSDPPELSFSLPAIYGKYCGPQTVPGTGSPADPTDCCCQQHDGCFSAYGCTASSQITTYECRECTRRLCECFLSEAATSFGEVMARTLFAALYACSPFFGIMPWALSEGGHNDRIVRPGAMTIFPWGCGGGRGGKYRWQDPRNVVYD